jgi:hypothetical protein
VDFQYRDPLAVVEAFFPPWLQIILFGFLGIVLMQWAIERQLGERRSLLLFVVFLGAAVFFGMRAVSLGMALRHSEPVITKTNAHTWTPDVVTNLIEQHRVRAVQTRPLANSGRAALVLWRRTEQGVVETSTPV